MFYRLAVYLFQPYTLSLGLVWLATARLWFRRRDTRARLVLLTAAVVLLTAISMPAVGYLAVGTLEWSYPLSFERPKDTRVIVVLGGGTRLMDESGEQAIPADDSMVRCLHAARLYHSGAPCPIVISGGKVDADLPGPSVARVMYDFLLMLGVRPEDMVLEDHSTTTYENAVECRPLLQQRGFDRVLLVTDAMHMWRASGCFAKQGLEVTPAPCNQQAAFFRWSAGSFAPSPDGMTGVAAAAHEWLGIAWYRLHGRI